MATNFGTPGPKRTAIRWFAPIKWERAPQSWLEETTKSKMPTSRLVPGRFPPQGASPIADRIRERRGARGLTPLDGTLLHVPPVADGWNSLLGAIRTKGKLSGDVRELMILRVAAINRAAFEWVHHEHVGRDHGLTTSQLYIVRDVSSLPAKNDNTLSPLQAAALAFAHHSTKSVQVPPDVTKALKDNLAANSSSEEEVQDLLVEAAAITASYNMVSRFLVSLDVAAWSDNDVPWPADRVEHKVPLAGGEGYTHVVTHTTHPDAPWIVCCNSLLTNVGMWDWALPYLLGPQEGGERSTLLLGKYKTFNVLLHDQRGHGSSSTDASAQCTIAVQASDIAHILDHLKIPTPIHSIIGVSQGGATALAFGAAYPNLVKSVVSCDTSARTPAGNKQAWTERIELAYRGGVDDQGVGKNMRELGQVTVARWFPDGSPCWPEGKEEGVLHRRTRSEVIMESMVMKTTLDGFKLGASALMEYNLLEGSNPLLASTVPTLLVAGALDGGGKFSGGGMKLSYPHDGAPAGTVMRDLKASQLESLYRIYGQRTTAFGNAIRKYYNGLLEYISSEHRWKDVYVPFGSTYNGMKMRQVRNKKWMVWCTHATGTQRHRENFPLFFKALRKWLDNPRVYEVTRDVGEYIGGRRSTTWEVEEEDLTDVDYEPEDCEGSEESGEEEDVRHDEQGTETEEFSDSQEEGNEDEVNTVADMDEGEDLPDERPTKRGKKVAHDDFVVDDDDPIILEDSDGASVLAEEDTDSGSDSDDTNFGDPKRSSVEDSDNSADSNSEIGALLILSRNLMTKALLLRLLLSRHPA
ncbi:hypothetical protein V5O48_007265 [Marasmius crinis-equi]|uniref:Uncharacterized protein n=1 Tax=Marasmius crinis-equi TaxID=585013 RepID=A0ABR3FH72_9AGAR